jgi:hypothetical protein
MAAIEARFQNHSKSGFRRIQLLLGTNRPWACLGAGNAPRLLAPVENRTYQIGTFRQLTPDVVAAIERKLADFIGADTSLGAETLLRTGNNQ